MTSPKAIATLAVTTALAALVVAPSSASAMHLTSAANPPSAGIPWGFNEDWGWRQQDFHPRQATRQLRYAGQIMPDDLSANRFHVQWAGVERRRGHYSWNRTDRVYEAMRQYSARPVMLLYNAPWWAQDRDASCPGENACAYPPRLRNLDDWTRFVRAALRRYPEVRAVEVWNEPNLARFWAPRPDPKRYSMLLRAAYAGVASTGVDVPVLVGGLLSPEFDGRKVVAAADFLRRVYELAGPGAFDGIATHPYPYEAPFAENMWSELEALRAVRQQFNDAGTPLWITEIGVSTHLSSGVGVDEQGDLLIDLYRAADGHDVRSFVIHRFQVGAEGGFWNGTAVVHNGLVAKPAFCEVGAAIGIPCESYLSAQR